MSKIVNYRKLLGVTKTTELKDLKSIYRNLMKEWHPDKFASEDDEKKLEAETKSKELIEAYHFLVSVAPETIEQALPQYTETISASMIRDYSYTKQVLQLNFQDGSSYEYFDVPRTLYTKLINSDTPGRFCRRHIYHEFVYRKVSRAQEV
ncbi:KTSC domain-containing protein [Chitinophaga nivalis]|uniref:KTSC domain-containing protein n=1 Tax=Chitinophaga nivalis TaxID=2991709 RepID=A0ABT3IQR9_9BACT|nr:KTSC domain-containing protein [Chitinophaga nivalis]MCW3463973.1 KTSC domain-containing protein [Chitinophaga nivalis]MCW3486337.1 KTSC domain-containing protein [Chitinophaga nivalis]